MLRKSINIKKIFLIGFVALTFIFNVNAQTINREEIIEREVLILTLDVLAVKSHSFLIPNAAGDPPFTVFIVSPGNRKTSNAKTARKFRKGLDDLLKVTERYRGLNYEIIEAKPRKGFGHFQIFFLNEKQEFAFDESIVTRPKA